MTAEDIYDTVLKRPQEVFHSYEGSIVDFDLADNLMVFHTDAGKVYFSGLWKYFVPTEVTLPKGTVVRSVAAGHDGFGVVDAKGRVLGWNGFVDTDKKYFDLNLAVADDADFEGKRVASIGGRYGGRFAFTA